MKMNGKRKKIIVGMTGFCLAIVIFALEVINNVTDVQAETRVFAKIADTYKTNGTFTILEIEPTNETYSVSIQNSGSYNVSKQGELGYFSSTPRRGRWGEGLKNGVLQTQLGARYGNPNLTYDDASYGSIIYEMRSYGMIRPDGTDAQGIGTGIGEYPIYSNRGAIFSSYKSDTCIYEYSDTYALGVYSDQQGGGYQLADGYKLDEDGWICRITEKTVSANELPDFPTIIETISENSIYKIEVLERLTDAEMDNSKVQLPTAADGTALITKAAEGQGNVKFTRSLNATSDKQYYGYTDLSLFYAKSIYGDPFYNSDWFREYVFGSNKRFKDMRIEYITKAANEVTAEMIDSADLIYINGKDSDFCYVDSQNVEHICDLSQVAMEHLYNKVSADHKALMMDYLGYGESLKTNISKLALLLWQEEVTSIVTKASELGAYNSDTQYITDISKLFTDADFVKKLQNSLLNGANGNFVTGNVYVYNHHLADFESPKSMVDAYDNFANGDFNSKYTSQAATDGFGEVLNYINATNKNSLTDTMPSYVTPAVAIQYILVSDGKGLAIAKSSLRVLEIEPTTKFLFNENRGSEMYGDLDPDSIYRVNRDNFVNANLSSYYNDKKKYITFTSMTIDEFNGKNEDLSGNYDLIYIGSETGINTDDSLFYVADVVTKNVENGIYKADAFVTQKLPVYNDPAMTGMVYYNIGDTVTVDDISGYLTAKGSNARYGARDLTKDKLKKLEDYLDEDGLVMVAGDLVGNVGTAGNQMLNPTAVSSGTTTLTETYDKGRVDSASNMYEFLNYGLGYRYDSSDGGYKNNSGDTKYTAYSNFVSLSSIAAGVVQKDDLSKYISTDMLSLEITEQPTEYAYQIKQNAANSFASIDETSIQYLDAGVSTGRTLTFKFKVHAEKTVTATDSSYTPRLYIDINNDGKFSEVVDNIKDMTVSVVATEKEAAKRDDGTYIIDTDVEYELKREISDELSGILKWKLDIQSNTYKNSHVYEEGYTYAKNITGKKKVIKILQITADDSNSTLNLQDELAAKDANGNSTSKLGNYLSNIPDCNVVARTMTFSDFQTKFQESYAASNTNKSLEEYAKEYFNTIEIVKGSSATGEEADADKKDEAGNTGIYGTNMLVLGAGSVYANATNANAIKAIEAYIDSGLPTLLTSEFIQYDPASEQVKQLRHKVGMDRYGVTQNIDNGKLVDVSLNKGDAYLHDGNSFSRTKAEDKSKVSLIESTGKTVAYQPGSEQLSKDNLRKTRSLLVWTTQGISNTLLTQLRNVENDNKWLNSDAAENYNQDWTKPYTVEQLNGGQLTEYPYTLPEHFDVGETNTPYFQLDLDSDADSDKESDVTVWYALGNTTTGTYDPFGDNVGGPDAANGYYVYNKGSVTYLGIGSASLASGSDAEMQLFVNTLCASFSSSLTKPAIGFFETTDTNAEPVTGISIPYDKNVTNPDDSAAVIDSSILTNTDGSRKYQFVDPNTNPNAVASGTPVYFRLDDMNFVDGQKYMAIRYYLKIGNTAFNKKEVGDTVRLSDGTNGTISEITVDDVAVKVVDISSKINTYTVSNGQLKNLITTKDSLGRTSELASGTTYGLYLPLYYLNETGSFTIYMEAQTTVKSTADGTSYTEEVEKMAYQPLTITKTDLLDLD